MIMYNLNVWFGNDLALVSFDHQFGVFVYHAGFSSPVPCGRWAGPRDVYGRRTDHAAEFQVCCSGCFHNIPGTSHEFSRI
jgi:hypothetical protein